jgi:ribosomal protein S18 acetylase RimI-like enzyme
VVLERDGRVAGYAAAREGGETILLLDPGDAPESALGALVAWLGERGRHAVDSYARDARRIAWLEANGFTYRRSAFDLGRGIDPPLAPPVWPPAVAVARHRPGADDAAVHALIYVDAGWGEVPGHHERSLEAWRSMLKPNSCAWVARRDGRPVGWVVGRVFGDGRGWVEQIAVARSARGLGLGRALLLHSLAELRSRGATSLATGVQAANENASGCTATSASRSNANGASTRCRRPEATSCRSVSSPPAAAIAAVDGHRAPPPFAAVARSERDHAPVGAPAVGRVVADTSSRPERRRMTAPLSATSQQTRRYSAAT